METVDKYIENTEIKVKNLLSDLYAQESDIQKDIAKTREKYKQKMAALENDYAKVSNNRKALQLKFEQLKVSEKPNYQNKKKDFELLLKLIEGDKDAFIKKAELAIVELGENIAKIEEKAGSAADDVKNDLDEKVRELNITKAELKEKIESVKSDSSEKWRDIKHWFIEKYEPIRKYFSNHF